MPNLSLNISGPIPSAVRQNWGMGSTASFLATAGSAYARCFGKEPITLNSIRAYAYNHGVAAVGAGWAEIAIATGTFVPNSTTQTLTYRAYVDIDAAVKAGATQLVGGLLNVSISPDDDIWLVVASSHATTQVSWRPISEDDHTGVCAIRADGTGATTRPSLNIGVARTFTTAIGTATVVPHMKYLYIS